MDTSDLTALLNDFSPCETLGDAVGFLRGIDHEDFRVAVDAYVRQTAPELMLDAMEHWDVLPRTSAEVRTMRLKIDLQPRSTGRNRFLCAVLDAQARLEHIAWQSAAAGSASNG